MPNKNLSLLQNAQYPKREWSVGSDFARILFRRADAQKTVWFADWRRRPRRRPWPGISAVDWRRGPRWICESSSPSTPPRRNAGRKIGPLLCRSRRSNPFLTVWRSLAANPWDLAGGNCEQCSCVIGWKIPVAAKLIIFFWPRRRHQKSQTF